MQSIYTEPKYVVRWRAGEFFPAGQVFDPLSLKMQSEYIFTLAQQGKVFMAGPFADGSGAMTIFNIDDEAEILSIINNNPAVVSKIVAADYVLWKPIDWQKFGEATKPV